MNNSNDSNTDGSQGEASRLGSFAGTHPDFRDDVPESFKQAPYLTRDFNNARDPLIKQQIEDMQKTESQRREERSGGGSTMIKRQKPHLELKPNHTGAHPATRQSFNQAWLQEQRSARMNNFEEERIKRKQQKPTQTQQYTPDQ